jgi:hypothetical protein
MYSIDCYVLLFFSPLGGRGYCRLAFLSVFLMRSSWRHIVLSPTDTPVSSSNSSRNTFDVA